VRLSHSAFESGRTMPVSEQPHDATDIPFNVSVTPRVLLRLGRRECSFRVRDRPTAR
jgi:hypothetical protein